MSNLKRYLNLEYPDIKEYDLVYAGVDEYLIRDINNNIVAKVFNHDNEIRVEIVAKKDQYHAGAMRRLSAYYIALVQSIIEREGEQ